MLLAEMKFLCFVTRLLSRIHFLCAGGKTELSLVEQLEEKIPIWLDTCGATVAVQELPFAVVIITPIMRRVHSTSFARDMCFVYSTTSNAADNNVITFMMVPTAAGAVPGAVLVTDSAVEATYVDAFKLLQSELQDSSFGGQCYPQSFITDDCPAKRAALAVCWPQSDLKLSVFHVSQAVWQWIWAEEQKIAKEDRPVLMSEFRRIIYSCSEGDTATAFNEAFHSPTAVRYEHYQDYLKDWWELRELWCLTYRSEHPKGRQVNNFAEVTARLYKDILNRSKACNVVALVDFTVHVMEEYYRCRLRDFANGRMPTHRLMIEKLSERSSYLRSRDQISDLGEGKFEVPSSDFTELYSVDANLGCCTCVFGLSGQFCEHQYAVMRLFKTAFSNVPSLDAASRYSIAKIALGPNCPPLSFYGGISDQSSSAVEMSCDGAHEGNASQDDVYETDCKQEATAAAESGSSMESLLAEYNNLIALNCARFADDLACWAALSKAVARLRTVSTSQSFAAFLHNAGVSRRNAPAAQPVSLARDAEASRGAKRSATCHRPSAGSGSCRTKRQRCPSAKRRS
jgi:hypothetical protein